MKINTLKILTFVLSGCMFVPGIRISAQTINAEYEKFNPFETTFMHSGMAMSPDQNYLAIAGVQNYPLYIYDFVNRKQLAAFDVGNWYAGSRVSWSAKGSYLLLQQLFFIDLAKNKDREVSFEVVDAASGKRVIRFEHCHDVKISADETSAIALTGNTLEIRSLPDGSLVRSVPVEGATNSLALSPDGEYIAISERPSDAVLKQDPQFKRNKKGLKFVKKYKQLVTVYRLGDFSRVASVNEYYDNIYRLDWSDDGQYIFCLNIPHAKATTATSGRQNFISVLDAVNFKSTRVIFPSNSNFEPDFRLSHNGRYMAVVSWGKFPEIRVHDFETGQVLQRFEMGSRLFEGISKLEFPSDGRVFVEFMPGDASIVSTFGNQLLIWNIPQE